MGKKLAIKGHSTRGEEVIKLLEMMGGKNTEGYIGVDCDEIYTIEDGYIIQSYDWNDCLVFTLEEFLEKYPFKIGDKVTNGFDFYTIKSMGWSEDCETMIYDFEDSVIVLAAEDMKLVNEDKTIDNSTEASQFMQLGKTVAVCFNTANYENEVELQLGDYEIVVRDGKTYAVLKKPAYPKTYEECCKVLRISPEFLIKYSVDGSDTERDAPLIRKFIKLKRCRDVYWKIAGEEMGLGKPWEPDWNKSKPKYTIVFIENELVKRFALTQSYILAFPTEEMRDAFYENFKNLIEGCKELL